MDNNLNANVIHLITSQIPSAVVVVDNNGVIVEYFMSNSSDKRRKKMIGKFFCPLVGQLFPDEAAIILDAYHQTKKFARPQMISRHEHTTLQNLKEYFFWNFVKESEYVLIFIRNITETVLIDEEFTGITEQYQNVNKELYTAMSNQDMYLMDMEQTKKQLAALYRITSIVQTTVDEQEVLDKILENVTQEFNLVNVALLLLDEVQQELVVRAQTGCFQDFCNALRIPVGKGICGYAVEHRELVYVTDVKTDSRYINGGIECVSELAIPLIVNDKVIGVFNVETTEKRKFRESELAMFSSITNQIASTIVHAKYIAEVQVQAVTDGMTGLYNYRYFRTILVQEFKRAKRYERPITILMMDIDSFKMYNDNYGHQKGDYVLRNVAELIRNAVRDVDLVMRYGGEEFVAVLPETTIQDAMIIAERIRQNIAEFPFENRETQPQGIISVSIGVAGFPRDSDSDVDLIQHADIALYAAKRASRNCIRAFHQVNTE